MATPQTDSAPPSGRAVDGSLAWAIVLVPIVGMLAEYLVGRDLWIPIIMANVGLCAVDAKRINNAGHILAIGWIFLIPVYLWKRAKTLSQAPIHFYAWLAAFAVSIAVPPFLTPTIDRDAACELVTEILRGQDSSAATCKGVTILRDPGAGFVKASALLSDGSEVPITIEMRGDSIEVQVLPR